MDKISIPLFGAVCFFILAFCSNSFSQWTFCGGVPVSGQISISVADPNTVAIVGGPSGVPMIYRATTGCNFTPLGTSGISYELYCVWIKDANTIFVGDGGAPGGAGGNAKVYKTTNGGVNWTTILSTGGSSGFINGIVFSRTMPAFGVAQSDPPNGGGQQYWVARTTDGGNTWSINNPPGIPGAYSTVNTLVVIDNLFYGFGINIGARVYVTANGGTLWTSSPLGIPGSFVTGFAFSSEKTYGIAATSSSLPIIARYSGSGWSQVNTGPGVTGSCTMKWVYGTNVCYLTGTTGAAGSVKKSTNAGLNWTQMTTSGVSGIIHMDLVYVGGIVYAYAVAQDGTVLRLIDNISGTNENATGIPAEYRLEQNFPNPFNPTTAINYSIPKASYVSIKVYDVLANEIINPVNEYKTAGNYSVVVNASELPSGVYFYTMSAGSFSDSKKMVLVK